MGLLQNGKWVDQWYDTKDSGGSFERQASVFRNWLTPDGSPGSDGQKGYQAEAGRYRLLVSLACPWAHRTLIVRALLGLEEQLPVTIVRPEMLDNGWELSEPQVFAGQEISYLYQLYLLADDSYEGRVTVPVLWDEKTNSIVSNESADIIRMLVSGFGQSAARSLDLYPESLRGEIDVINQRIYDTVNNGVYKAGFATAQDKYEDAVVALFETLDWLDARLEQQRYLCGTKFTEADIRLFTTLVRFDAVYHGHFKCNLRPLSSYSNISAYVRELYQLPGVAETVNIDHIKTHYYVSHKTINPTEIVPLGPQLQFTKPHDRDALMGETF